MNNSTLSPITNNSVNSLHNNDHTAGAISRRETGNAMSNINELY